MKVKLEAAIRAIDGQIARHRTNIAVMTRDLEETKAQLREMVGRRSGYQEVLDEINKNDVHNGERPHNVPSGEGAQNPIAESGQPNDSVAGGSV